MFIYFDIKFDEFVPNKQPFFVNFPVIFNWLILANCPKIYSKEIAAIQRNETLKFM